MPVICRWVVCHWNRNKSEAPDGWNTGLALSKNKVFEIATTHEQYLAVV